MNASAFLSALFDNLLYFSVSENKLLISKAKEAELRDLTRIAFISLLRILEIDGKSDAIIGFDEAKCSKIFIGEENS